jgi:hypothetical protein
MGARARSTAPVKVLVPHRQRMRNPARSARCLAATLLVLLTATGCFGHDAKPVVEGVGPLIASFEHETEDLRGLDASGSAYNAWKSRLTNAETGQDSAALNHLRAAEHAQAAVTTALSAAAAHTADLETAGPAVIVYRRAGGSLTSEGAAQLKKVSGTLAEQVGCNIVWQSMTSDEHKASNALVTKGVLTYTFGVLINDTEEGLKDEALKLVAGAFSPALEAGVDWAQYLMDINKKVGDIVQTDANGNQVDLRTTINLSNGQFTYALYEYARTCLRLPKSE